MNSFARLLLAVSATTAATLWLSGTCNAQKPVAKVRIVKRNESNVKFTLKEFRKAANIVQDVLGSTTCDELPPKLDAQGRAIALRFRVKTAYPGYVAMFWDEDRPAERATTRYHGFYGSQGPQRPPDWIVPSYNPLQYSYLWMSGFFQAGTTELTSAQQDFQVDLPHPLTQTVEGWADLAPNVLAPRIAILLIPSIKAIGVDYPISRKPGTTFFPVDIWNYRRIEPCVHDEYDRRWGK